AKQCQRVGFDAEHAVLPQAPGAHPAYGLLQEYFAFPAKFHFFDIHGLGALKLKGQQFSLRLDVGAASRKLRALDAEYFRLGCTVAVNLFPRTSEPAHIDHTRHEVMLVGDRAREASTEIHSIVQVTASEPGSDQPLHLRHIAALQTGESVDDVFWMARRERSLRDDLTGTDVFVSFVDRRQQRRAPSAVVYARTLCTNRGLAEQITPQTLLIGEGVSNGLQIRCVSEPSRQRMPPLGSDTLWRLVSLLNLQHQSFISHAQGRDHL
ncbi:MAG: type VI secretion system baseplate subunit TssF, partial [Burkholderiaceae bacterium]